MKKKIVFLSPRNKGGTYFYYKEISEYLIKNYSNIYDVYFYNSLIDYIKLHFIKADVVFSIIPFLFKPLGSKKFFFNLHGNYKVERKNKGLGVKLLYLTELNLWFSDKIVLTSYYLADKLNFRKRYNNKIEIIPNFVSEVEEKNQQLNTNELNFLTITSFKFYNKGKGIINLGKVIKKIGKYYNNSNINFTIVGNENNEIFNIIKSDFDKIKFPNNVNIIWKGWLNKDAIKQEFLENNTFLYWTELDNFPGVILEALNYNLKVYVNNFESFKYFLNENIICKDERVMFDKIINKEYKKESLTYKIKTIIIKIVKMI